MIDSVAFGTGGGPPRGGRRLKRGAMIVASIGLALTALPPKAASQTADMGRQAGFAAIAPEYEPALLIAVRVALNKAELTSWSSDNGREGYVTISAPRIRGGWECRMYRYTVTQDGRDWLSPDSLACRDDPSNGWNLRAGMGW